jgi:cytochrome c oxidase cbb3-type subunit 4
MEDTYTIMRVFAGSWGALFMFLSFVGRDRFHAATRQQERARDTANIPFRHDDRPASEDATAPTRQFKEARQ